MDPQPYKIVDQTGNKHGVVVSSLESLIQKAHEKFGIDSSTKIKLLESDGTQVDDENYFKTLERNTCFRVLRENERWIPSEEIRGEVAVAGLSSEEPPLKLRRLEEPDHSLRPRTLALKNKLRQFVASSDYNNPEQLITEAVFDFSVLESDYLTLADGVGLLLLRGRIEQLEMKFMVGKLEAVDLKKALSLNDEDMKDILQRIMMKLKPSDQSSGSVNPIVTQEILNFQQTSLVGGARAQVKDPNLSDSVFEKASIHYLRWKYVFKFPKHPTVKKMLALMENNSEINEDIICMEIAYLFITLSDIGVHLHIVPNVGLESILRSLKLYSLNEKPTVITVKLLYCDLFDCIV